MFLLPVRFGGLGLSVPVSSAVDLFTVSQHATQLIIGAIKHTHFKLMFMKHVSLFVQVCSFCLTIIGFISCSS